MNIKLKLIKIDPKLDLDRKDLIFSKSGITCFSPCYFAGEIIGYLKFVHGYDPRSCIIEWIYKGKYTEKEFIQSLSELNKYYT